VASLNFRKRLEAAAAAAKALRKTDKPDDGIGRDVAMLKYYLIGAYLGGLQLERDSPATAHKRALGYETTAEYVEAMGSGAPEFAARQDNAMRCLFWHAGIEEPNDTDDDEKIAALDRLIAGLRPEFRQDLGRRLRVLTID
jgi:hypothetical protein